MSKFKNLNVTPAADELERVKAGDKKPMFSTRLEQSDLDYIKAVAYHFGKSNQDVVAEALELLRSKYPV